MAQSTKVFAQEPAITVTDVASNDAVVIQTSHTWKVACEMGGAMARGNSRTGTLNSGCGAEWQQNKLKLSAKGGVAYGRAFYGNEVSYYANGGTAFTKTPESKKTTQKNAEVAIREDYFVSGDHRSYVFSLQSFGHNKFAGFTWRLAAEAGAGHTYVLTNLQSHAIEAGVQYEREKTVLNNQQNRLGLIASILGTSKFNEYALFEYKVSYLPAFTNSDDFRIDGSSGLNIQLGNRVSFKTSLNVLYDHDPNQVPATDAAGNPIAGFVIDAQNTDLTWNNLLVIAIF